MFGFYHELNSEDAKSLQTEEEEKGTDSILQSPDASDTESASSPIPVTHTARAGQSASHEDSPPEEVPPQDDTTAGDSKAVESLKITTMMCTSPTKQKKPSRVRKKKRRPSSRSSTPSHGSVGSKGSSAFDAVSPLSRSLSPEQQLVARIARLQNELREKEEREIEVAEILGRRVLRRSHSSRKSLSRDLSGSEVHEMQPDESDMSIPPGLRGVPPATLAVMTEEEKVALGKLHEEIESLRVELQVRAAAVLIRSAVY